jgi:hypothetical protein
MAKYKGRGIVSETAEPWEQPFLDHYQEFGGITLSAKLAGVTTPYVRKRREASPTFAEKFEEAHEHFVDSLEKLMVQMGKGQVKSMGFLAIIARLKAERPSKYNDKLQVTGAIGHIHAAPPPEEVNALLRAMLAGSMPETRAQIAGDVIDADSPDQPKE